MGPLSVYTQDSSSETLRFPKLNGSNYHVWSDNMKAALQARLLWLFVEGLEICPSKPSMDPPVDSSTRKPVLVSSAAYKEWIAEKKEYLEWLWSDSAAMGLMRGAIEFGQREHIASASSSKDLWDCLHRTHVTQRQGINVHYHYQELYTKKWDEQTMMSDHIGSFLHLRRRINDSGQTLDNIHIIHAILLSLPHSSIWDIVKQNLLDKGTTLSLNIVTAELLSVHDRMERERILDETEKRQKSDQMALVAKSSLGTSTKSNTPGTKKKFKKGHFKPWRQPTNTTCYFCGEKGHWSSDCPKKGESKDHHSKPGGSAHIAIQPSGSREVGKMLMAVGNSCKIGQADMASVVGSITGILLDCVATAHMFMERSLFTTYEALTNNEYITVGGRHQVPVAGVGSVSLNMILPNGTSILTLTDVFHIPTLGANLVSLGVLHCKGVSVRSWINGLIISKDNEDLFSATLGGSTGTLYQVQCTNLNQGSAYISTGALSMGLWHRRMGHLNPKMIHSMFQERIVKGLDIHAPKDFDQLCNGCANGKSHHLPMPETSTSKYSKMELLVMDLTGPMTISTWDGYQYALVVIEASCRYAVG